MKIVSYTEARQNLASLMDSVVDDAEEAVITRNGHESAVLVSLAEWSSIKETEFLLSDPATAAELRESMAQLDAGEVEEFEPIDPDAMRASA